MAIDDTIGFQVNGDVGVRAGGENQRLPGQVGGGGTRQDAGLS